MHTVLSSRQETESTQHFQANENVSALFKSVFNVQLATSPKAIDEVFKLRYQVYCIDRPFEDSTCFADKRERDAYDPQSAHALIRHRITEDSVAAVRLVMADTNLKKADFPMETPCLHLMDKYAREAFKGTCRKQIAEISRMAVSREFRRRLNENISVTGISEQAHYSDSENGRRAMPYICLGLFSAILRMSIKHGITHWMAVLEPALLRLLKRFGVEFDHVGPVLEYHGRRQPVFTDAESLIRRAKRLRPDVWSLVTDDGKYLPVKPNTDVTTSKRKVA